MNLGNNTSSSCYEGCPPNDLLQDLRSHVEDFSLPIKQSDSRLDVFYNSSRASFFVEENGFRVDVHAHNSAQLYQTREAVIYLLDHVWPKASKDMTWSGDEAESLFPPNFQIGHVLSVQRVSANFLRVAIKCKNLEQMSSGAMHFSLLLPPEGGSPIWPTMNDKKRTVWPSGENELHRAVYTFVEFDVATTSFSFDLYEHACGRTTRWARSVLPGQIVGIMGPGGGNFPVCDDLLIAGDETALPAIRRILETAPAHVTGRAIIEIGDANDISLLNHPTGVQIDWVSRATESGLWPELSRVKHVPKNTFVWIAAERELVRKAKATFLEIGASKEHSYFSGYWAQS